MKKLLFTLILLAALAWIAYPYLHVYRLGMALKDNDRAAIAELVDVDAVRNDQRTRMEQRANQAIGKGDDPISKLLRDGASILGAAAIDTTVDQTWVRKQLTDGGKLPDMITRVDYAFFDAWNSFVVRVGELGDNPLHFRMAFADWRWRVVALYPG
ncbi:MAG: DUF2939 domain-containing protein [Gammaproteobacteria bacterium]|nr:DUF2939 domain-containing protein [Gammaproteobacteria bacterium]